MGMRYYVRICSFTESVSYSYGASPTTMPHQDFNNASLMVQQSGILLSANTIPHSRDSGIAAASIRYQYPIQNTLFFATVLNPYEKFRIITLYCTSCLVRYLAKVYGFTKILSGLYMTRSIALAAIKHITHFKYGPPPNTALQRHHSSMLGNFPLVVPMYIKVYSVRSLVHYTYAISPICGLAQNSQRSRVFL